MPYIRHNTQYWYYYDLLAHKPQVKRARQTIQRYVPGHVRCSGEGLDGQDDPEDVTEDEDGANGHEHGREVDLAAVVRGLHVDASLTDAPEREQQIILLLKALCLICKDRHIKGSNRLRL